jgi:hypothetical protein
MKSYFLLFIALASCASAQETSTKPPFSSPVLNKSQIIFPIIPVLNEKDVQEDDLPSPPPERLPKFVSDLSEETWLVIESEDPIVVTSSPLGHVTVQPEEGPVKVRGKFADGTGKIETRVFSSKYLYFVNAIKQGKIEILIFTPQVVTEEKDIPRFPLNVMGIAPIPPPGPGPGPGPGPKPPDPVSDAVFIAVVEDVLNRTPDAAIVMNAMAGWVDLAKDGSSFRSYHIETGEVNGKKAIQDAAGLGLPAMVVYDKPGGKVLRAMPLPLTFDGVKRVISELTGG